MRISRLLGSFVLCFILLSFAKGQGSDPRLALYQQFAPFYQGVASGDPTESQVILWSRITPTDTTLTYAAQWRVALDTGFTQVVASGNLSTDASKDFTLKVDVTGLQPNTWYYYDFREQNGTGRSVIGRTRTLPAASAAVNQLRLAVVTCADYKDGWFNAYARMAVRNDIDLVLHLGDYIYESNSDNNNVRQMQPNVDVATLGEYRGRYAHYRLDPDLQYLHQQYPFITVWDDHETRNDAWRNGSDKVPDSLAFAPLKQNARTAYFDWMPIRENPQAPGRLYRHFSLGSLADLFMLDTRGEDRDKQITNWNDPAINDPARRLIGPAQSLWLRNGLDSSQARWKLIGQQVIMMPIRAPQLTFPVTYRPVNEDQWDGYPAERARILNFIDSAAIRNVAVFTGDAHISFAGDLPFNEQIYNRTTGAGSAAVELVTPSIAANQGDLNIPAGLTGIISTVNPHIKYSQLQNNGYLIVSLSNNKLQGDYYYVNTALTWSNQEFYGASWYADSGLSSLKSSNSAQPAINSYPQPAPLPPTYNPNQNPTSRAPSSMGLLNGIYPNLAQPGEWARLHFAGGRNTNFKLYWCNTQGQIIHNQILMNEAQTPNQLEFVVPELPAGLYFLRIDGLMGKWPFWVK